MMNIKLNLPDGFLEEEVRCGYTVSAYMKKIWAVELDLLAEFIRVCKKYGLKCYADGGTLLGVMRHKGFIPWDDDIDISMPRGDYDKLCTVAETEFKSPYFFQTLATDPDCPYLHAKLRNSSTSAVTETDRNRQYNQGIWIDIFPLDNVPDCEFEKNRFIERLSSTIDRQWYYNQYVQYFRQKTGHGPIKFVRHFIKHLYVKYLWRLFNPFSKVCDKTYAMMTLNNTVDCKRFANLSMLYYVLNKNLFWQKEWYAGERFGSFEFMEIPIPAMSEAVLDLQYGDWHKFIKGQSCHLPKYYDVEKPYTSYLTHN